MIVRKIVNKIELIEILQQLNLNADYIMGCVSKNKVYNGNNVSIIRNIRDNKICENEFIIAFNQK